MIHLLLTLLTVLHVARCEDTTPIVLWHGLGDDCCENRGISQFIATLHEVLPQRPILSIRIGKDAKEDRWHSLFGSANEQVAKVCTKLRTHLRDYETIDAIGFSQGGQLLRAYVERCNVPRLRHLVTFGSQHYGVVTLPGCPAPNAAFSHPNRSDRLQGAVIDELRSSVLHGQFKSPEDPQWKLRYPKCSWWKRLLLDSRLLYTDWMQRHILPAQYFRDATRIQEYLEYSDFLADVNNERGVNTTYRNNLQKLASFTMFMFANDTVVIPKESAWFAHIDATGKLIPLNESTLYKQDWIGVRTLDEQGRLHFESLPGQHMSISHKVIQDRLVPLLSSHWQV